MRNEDDTTLLSNDVISINNKIQFVNRMNENGCILCKCTEKLTDEKRNKFYAISSTLGQ